MCDNSHQQLADNKDVLVRGITNHDPLTDMITNMLRHPARELVLFGVSQDCGDVVVWWFGGV